MQVKRAYYNPEVHDIYKAVCVRQPMADCLVRTAYIAEGERHALYSIEMRTRRTKYRGDVMICSSKKPVVPGRESGVTIGLVELYDVIPAKDMTEEDWRQAGVMEGEDRELRKTWYGWRFRNPRRVVEMPVTGGQGLFDLVVPKGDITIYPNIVKLGVEKLCKRK